jgi:hypothetical protein
MKPGAHFPGDGPRAAIPSRLHSLQPGTSEDWYTDLEITEDGEIRFLHASVGRPWSINGLEYPALFLDIAGIAVREILAIALHLSDRAGHIARWELGVAVTGIEGARPRSTDPHRHDSYYPLGYPSAAYRKGTQANVLELGNAPGAMAERLLGRLYRALDVSDSAWFTIPFKAPDAADPEAGD